MSRRRNPKSALTPAIPSTTDLRIVFPYDKRHNRFLRRFYTPDLTDEKLDYNQISTILKKFEVIVKTSQSIVNTVIYVFLALALIGFGLILYFDLTLLNSNWTLVVSLSMGFFGIFVLGTCFIYMFCSHVQKETRKMIYKEITSNDDLFKSQGLRWNLPPHFPKWIELWKDYKTAPSAYDGVVVLTKQENCVMDGKQDPRLAQTRESSSYENIPEDKEAALWKPLLARRQA